MKAVKGYKKLGFKTKECNLIMSPNTVNLKDRDKDPRYMSMSLDSGVDGLKDSPDVSTVNGNDVDLPEYIVDPISKTTYLKGRFLGKGGFARVHEVTDLTTNIVYAGKIIPKSRITKPHHKNKITREVSLHSCLNHKHIVRFHKYFEDDDNVYIILENCPRKSLVHVMKHRSALKEEEVRYYLRQLIEGVQYIHSHKIIHRDLKLGNMFLTEDMVMKIGDFGLASHVDVEKIVTICGTPNYIAPEVLKKHSHGFEADVWAIGCIMYAMLIGQPPFETSTLNETYFRIANNKYTFPPMISESAKSLIRLLLHPNPSNRPSLEETLRHNFFTRGYTPKVLPSSCCMRSPAFHVIPEDNLRFSERPKSMNESPVLPKEDIKKITSSLSMLKVGQNEPIKSHIVGTAVNQNQTRSLGCQDLFAPRPKSNAHRLHVSLSICLDTMPEDSLINPPTLPFTPVFVTKWIDYSNKYGFGFQLCDGSVGVLFNDSSEMDLISRKSQIRYEDTSGKVHWYPTESVPSLHQEKYTLLRYFVQYMDENLTDGGDTKQRKTTNNNEETRRDHGPQMRKWMRSSDMIAMELTNGTFQVNFLRDHTKLVFSDDESLGLLMTFINGERYSQTYRLLTLARIGCPEIVRERIIYALSFLGEFKEMDDIGKFLC